MAAKKHISPVLAWSWLIATIIADVVYCSAQYGLGTDAVQNNLGFLNGGRHRPTRSPASSPCSASASCGCHSAAARHPKLSSTPSKGSSPSLCSRSWQSSSCSPAQGSIAWGSFFDGLIPDFSALFKPTASYSDAIAATGDNASFWTKYISDSQRNIIIGAFGSAVGINMTFLLPYTLIKRGWSKQHRELSRFDLVLGLFVPFIMATSFLVVRHLRPVSRQERQHC